MEFKTVVYNAARDGKLSRLKIFLDSRSRDEVKILVESKTNDATPLIMSCRNGHLNVVEYLIQKCGVEIEQTGSVTFDGETIEGAPPLWCAAAAGHMDIVRLLINNGANVNKTTRTNSTPLRAACFDGHSEITQFLVEQGADIELCNRHGHTCLMIACYKGHEDIVKFLLQHGANVNRKSLKGNTALHDCAESGSLEIMKLLLTSGAEMEKDSYGMTPLLAAAVTGHPEVVNHLLLNSDVITEERVDALHVLGATFVDRKRDIAGGAVYWRQAMQLQTAPPTSSPKAVYDNAAEVTSLAELEDLVNDPEGMRMQALLVRERILGPSHPDTSYYIRYRGAVYADMGAYERCVQLWQYALDMQQTVLEPLNPMTLSSLLSFAELFSFIASERGATRARSVAPATLVVVLESALRELERAMSARTPRSERDPAQLTRLLLILLHVVSLGAAILDRFSTAETTRFKRTVYRMVKLNPRENRGYTPLHLACCAMTSQVGKYPVCTFPSPSVAALLLEVGASVNALDKEHNTPLHVAAMSKPVKPLVMKVLLRNGAHIDACNLSHKNPMQLLRGVTIYDIVSPLNFMTLQCLCARKIVEHDVSYVGHVPQKLERFIKMH